MCFCCFSLFSFVFFFCFLSNWIHRDLGFLSDPIGKENKGKTQENGEKQRKNKKHIQYLKSP